MRATLLFLVVLFSFAGQLPAQKRPLTFDDVMKFKQLRNPVISDGGNWVGFDSWPDRGDGEAIVQHVKQNQKRFVIPLGQRPFISADEKWAGIVGKPSLEAEENAKKKKTKTFGDVTLIQLQNGAISTYKGAKAFEFSGDGKWALVHFNLSDSLDKVYKKTTKRTVGTKLIIKELTSGKDLEIPFVYSAAFDSVSGKLVYSVADTSGKNGLHLRLPADMSKDSVIHSKKDGIYEKLKWHYKTGKLAFSVGIQDKEGKTSKADLHIWPGTENGETIVRSAERFRTGWTIPIKGELNWSNDGKFVYFGIRLDPAKPVSYDDSAFKAKDYYNQERILSGIEGDLWHGDEPRIKTQEKKVKDAWKTRFFTAVYSLDQKNYTVLSDTATTGVRTLKNAPRALVWTEMPHAKEALWEGGRIDVSVVDFETGFRRPVAEKLRSPGEISPDGKFVAYWKAPHWYLFNVDSRAITNLTEGLPVRFDEEDNDLPTEPQPYGFGGWTSGTNGLLLYDKFDMWLFPVSGGSPKNITVNGRANGMEYRIERTNPDIEFVPVDKPLLLQARHDQKKYQGFYSVSINKPGAVKVLEDAKKFSFVAKPKKSDGWLYTRESYNDFPDLWFADASFKKPVRISALNPVIQEIAWGTPELVEWKSPDGKELQGVLIKPEGFQSGKPVPVLVYFYEIMSGRMYDFPAVNVDTRPDFPQFASDGYAVFLPDIKYSMDGKPMDAALHALVSGVKKIVAMGVADSTRIGLHGHSWGGTQTTYIIAKSNVFKAALAGAPVTNWVSAYSGIRWQTGLARQFQYERQQSRIGVSLWENPDLYLENSAVWHADKIQTPLLLQHGDADGSVPWYQSIEMYLALRRLQKPVWFLQYFGEDHHLAKYPNKLDYAIKFKEYFDFYLKDKPQPEWMKTGIPYMPKFD